MLGSIMSLFVCDSAGIPFKQLVVGIVIGCIATLAYIYYKRPTFIQGLATSSPASLLESEQTPKLDKETGVPEKNTPLERKEPLPVKKTTYTPLASAKIVESFSDYSDDDEEDYESDNDPIVETDVPLPSGPSGPSYVSLSD